MNKFPEIRKDLQYELVCKDWDIYLSWKRLYASLPNVKVIFDPNAEEQNG
jgi:hypothetical protein